MAAIAHIALTAGIDKSLTWVTKPPLVLGEGGGDKRHRRGLQEYVAGNAAM